MHINQTGLMHQPVQSMANPAGGQRVGQPDTERPGERRFDRPLTRLGNTHVVSVQRTAEHSRHSWQAAAAHGLIGVWGRANGS